MCKLTDTTTTNAKLRNKNDANTSVSTASKPLKQMSRKEVCQTSNPDDNLLIVIDQFVFNVTNWQFLHPGGHLTLRALCGKDATDAFYSMHPRIRTNQLLQFVKLRPVAMLAEEKASSSSSMTAASSSTITTRSSEQENALKVKTKFRELTQKLYEDGMFETRYSYFVKVVLGIFSMFGTVLYLVLKVCPEVESLFMQRIVSLCAGALLGLVWQQVAFIGHDLGHNGVTHNRIMDSSLGVFFGNFFTGFSIVWWKRSHNVHHIVTNSIEHDPDIQHLPIFAITPTLLHTKVFSTFFRHELPSNNMAHVLVKYQHWLYYPVMAFARFNLYVQSLLHALRLGAYSKEKREYIWAERMQVVSLLGYHVWITLLTLQLPDLYCQLLFFVLAHNVAGILHIQITLSHFCMPTYNGVTYDNDHNGFLMTQLRTSLDIDCPAWMDWFHGGLQFQTVHHIWPRIPRHNLREVQSILIDFCIEHGLEYKRMGFVDANKYVLAKLKQTAETTKSFHEIFAESFHLLG